MANIHIVKNLCKWLLIALLTYATFLSIRDSDKLTFENRLIEMMKFMQQNSKAYRESVESSLNHNVKEWDGAPHIPTVKDLYLICPIVVLASGQVAAIGSVFLVLNSRIGAFVGFLHGVFISLTYNFIHFRSLTI